MGPGAPIAQFVNFLAERGRASRIISVGGISALDLPLEPSQTERIHFDPGSFAEKAFNAGLLRGGIVLCLGTFDSVADPQPLLGELARLRDSADFMLFCVKDRVRHTGFVQGTHSTSRPVWAAEAFAQALYDAGFVEPCLMG